MQLLVGRATGAERELLDTVAGEACVRVAVDEPRQGAEAAAVELLGVADAAVEVAHPPHRLDAPAAAEDIRILGHLDAAEVATAQRRALAGRRHHLREVPDEQRRSGARVRHARCCGCIGGSKPCSRPNSIASA